MRDMKVTIFGYGNTGKAALTHLLQRVADGVINITTLDIVDIRPNDIDEGAVRTLIHDLTGGKEISLAIHSSMPHNSDLYWICIPFKRNVHDNAADVKPLNKLTSSIMNAYHSGSIIINSTMVPMGRNAKLYDKITMKSPEDTSWLYMPINNGRFNACGVAKYSRSNAERIKALMLTLDVVQLDITALEFTTLEHCIIDAAMARLRAELDTIAECHDIDPRTIRQARRVRECVISHDNYSSVENGDSAAQMITHKFKGPKQVPIVPIPNMPPIMTSMWPSAEYRTKYIIEEITKIAHEQAPNSTNESFIFIYGSSEFINRIMHRLYHSNDLPEHVKIYQIRSPHAHALDVSPEVWSMTREEAMACHFGTHILMDKLLDHHLMTFNREYL